MPPEITGFIERLGRLDPGLLARFKRNSGENLAGSRGVLPTFYQMLPRKVTAEEQAETYFLVATLYAIHPRPGGSGNLAETLKSVVNAGGNLDGISRRLAILIDSHRGELPFRLRQAVQFVRSHEIPIAWPTLLSDLLHWDHPRRMVQKKWAGTFFGSSG